MSELLTSLAARVPYLSWLGVSFTLQHGEPVAHLPFAPHLIGNPTLPALHGGVTAAFLETTALIALSWSTLRARIEAAADAGGAPLPRLPRTIDITTDYLRRGRREDCYASAVITRTGRRYASVRVQAWQADPARPFAEAMGHFLMPQDRPA